MKSKIFSITMVVLAGIGMFALARSASAASLTLSPATKSVSIGDTFTVDILLNTSGAAVDGVDIKSIHYNPYYLQLIDGDGGTAGVQIAPGSLMPNTLTNTVDTQSGKIDFSQITNNGTNYTGSGVLATITFKALVAGTATVQIDYTAGNTTDSNVASGGNDVLTSVTNGIFTINYPTVVTPTPTTPPPGPTPGGTTGGTYQVHLINQSGTFYLVYGGAKHGVTSPGILYSWGFEFKDALTPTAADLAMPDGEILLPGDGALVKSPVDPTVWLISGGQKYGFVSSQVFTTLGFKFSEVLTVTTPELNKQARAADISDPALPHLDGVHINDNGTVYWLNGGSKWAYPSRAVYNSWRRDDYFGDVPLANAADRALPMGGIIPLRVNQ